MAKISKSAPRKITSSRPKSTTKTRSKPTKSATSVKTTKAPKANGKSGDRITLSKTEKPARSKNLNSLTAGLQDNFASPSQEKATTRGLSITGKQESQDPAKLFRRTVKDGETLTGIATDQLQQSGFNKPSPNQVSNGVNGISKLNKLDDPNRINAGQELRLPRDLAEGPVFKKYSDAIDQGVFPSSNVDGDQMNMARILRSDAAQNAPGKGELGEQDTKVDERFNQHMKAIDRSHIQATTSTAGTTPSGTTLFTSKVVNNETGRPFYMAGGLGAND